MTAATSARKADAARIAELESELGLPPSLPGAEPGLQVSPDLAEQTKPGIISLRSARSPEPEKRIPAFSINGTVYTLLANPRMNQGMRYVHIARKQGSEIAADYMLEVLLGEDGYEALLGFDDLAEPDLEAILNAASRIMAGAVETPKGKQPRGSGRSRG
jgi:hypothetical protein